MILNITLSNFLSFKEPQIFDFTDKNNLPQNIFTLIGKNAAGKSNVIKALLTLKQYITKSYLFPPDQTLYPTPNKFFPFESSDIEIEFLLKGSKYTYKVNYDFFINYESLTKDGKLIFNIAHKEQSEFNKQEMYNTLDKTGVITTATTEFKSECSELQQQEKENSLQKFYQFVRPNSSFLSILKHLNIDRNSSVDAISDVYKYFDSMFIGHGSQTDVTKLLHNNVIGKAIESDSKYKDYLLEYMKTVDTEIDTINIEQIETFVENIELKFELKMNDMQNITTSKKKTTVDKLTIIKDNKEFKTTELSEGTLKALYYANLFYESSKNGAIIIIDEIEIGLHPTLLKKILQNIPKNTQLIFTTHSLLVLDYMKFYSIGITEMIDHSTKVILLKNKNHDEEKQFQIMRRYLSGEYEKKEISLDMDMFN